MTYSQIHQYYQHQPLILRLYIRLRLQIIDIQKILNLIPRETRSIMELGCGYGIASFSLAQQFQHKPIRAYDIDRQRIELLNSINPHPNLKFYLQSALKINTFDADTILMMDFLHHISYADQEMLLKRIHQSTTENVNLIIKDMDRGKFSFRQFCNYLIDIVHTKELKFYYHDRRSFTDLFERCGFKIQNVTNPNKALIPLNHILFLLQKK